MPTNDMFAPWLKSKELSYSLKVWLTCLALGPVVFALVLWNMYLIIFMILVILYMFICGVFYAIPSLVLFYVIVKLINRTKYSLIIKKSVLIAAGIVLAVIPFYVPIPRDYIDVRYDNALRFSYFIAVIPGLLFYKLPLKEEEEAMDDVSIPQAE